MVQGYIKYFCNHIFYLKKKVESTVKIIIDHIDKNWLNECRRNQSKPLNMKFVKLKNLILIKWFLLNESVLNLKF